MTTRATGRTIRLALALSCLAGAAGAAPARAEFPIAVRADGGIGIGGGSLEETGVGASPFTQLGLGIGRVGSSGPLRAGYGPAIDAALGYRLVPDPGPLGFVLTLRTHHVFGLRARAHMVTMGLGLALHPR